MTTETTLNKHIQDVGWAFLGRVYDGMHEHRSFFPFEYFAGGKQEAHTRATIWVARMLDQIANKPTIKWNLRKRKQVGLAPGSFFARDRSGISLICRLYDPDGNNHNFKYRITDENIIHVAEQMGIFYHYTIKQWDPYLAGLYSPTQYRDELLKSILIPEDYHKAMKAIYKDQWTIARQ